LIANSDDELIYENLCLIINEFEKAALLSGTRRGALVVANNPLSALDSMLAGSDRALGAVAESRVSDDSDIFPPTAGPPRPEISKKKKKKSIGIEFDADLQDLFGGNEDPNDPDSGSPVANYIEDCLGCDLRLQFDWQLKPINLLGGIQGILDGIGDVLDQFENFIHPWSLLDGLCHLLDLLKGFCIPDLITLLMSLKMLLKRYVSEAINIQLDWTVVLGPLLKAIIEGITSLLEQLAGVILAPLDCALDTLTMLNELERNALELVGQAQAFAQETADQAKALGHGQLSGTDLDLMVEDYRWGGSTVGQTKYPDAPQFGRFTSQEREAKFGNDLFQFDLSGVGGKSPEAREDQPGFQIPTGFRLTRDTRLEEALKDPTFAKSTFTEKLIVPLQEAKKYI